MPKLKKYSSKVMILKRKLKRKQIMDKKIERFEELETVQGSSVLLANDIEEIGGNQLKLFTIAEKHAEYVRNYRKNMPEEKKIVLRAIAARKMALRRESMSEEKKAAIRATNRLRIALKRKNMSEEEKSAQREYHRQRMAFKRQNMTDEERKVFRENQRRRMALKRKSMTEEQKKAAREVDRQRMALKRQKEGRKETDCFHTAMIRLALQRQYFLPPPVDLEDSSNDNDAPEDIQRFLAITLITGHSITSN